MVSKMGLLGSQAVLEKKVSFKIMSNFLAPFLKLCMGEKIIFIYFLHCKKLLNYKIFLSDPTATNQDANFLKTSL